ncbi:MAG: hypothetical protein JOY67_05260, partial [Hyphomicrobiales bacterium]|nr:hypothetical protein [Hyphomicrobiales bacterium]
MRARAGFSTPPHLRRAGPLVTLLILRRFASALPILVMVSLIAFGLMRLVPGDPSAVIAGLSATPEQ